MEFLPPIPQTGLGGIPLRGSRDYWAAIFLLAISVTSFSAMPAEGADLSLQMLSEFGSNPKNPQAGLTQANDGNLYGTTELGGTNGENGTIFRITPSGSVAQLFSFNGTNDTSGICAGVGSGVSSALEPVRFAAEHIGGEGVGCGVVRAGYF